MAEETVEVPARLLTDLAYHFNVTSSMQAIPSSVVAPLAELAPEPDPDEELIKQIRFLVGPEIHTSSIERIISAVRNYS